MFIFGGFVVEGRLGFNVGELLALDLNSNEFFYPEVVGDLPVRRNKHTAVLDDRNNMWLWGGSVWDHTGGSATYASTATHVADLSDPRRVVWRAAETKGSPPSQRRLHASVIKDGVMYVIGGEDYHSKRFLQDVHALDLETLSWSQPATAGSAGGGRIRAAAVSLRVADGAALEGCGEGAPSPAVTGELQPRNDKLVTALQESTAAVGKKHTGTKKQKGVEEKGEAYDELFAAMLGTRSVVGDAKAIRAGWVPVARRGAKGADEENTFVGDLGSGLLVESRGMWELHLLADVPDVGLLELQADDLPEFQFQGRADGGEVAARAEKSFSAPDLDAGGWAREAGRGGKRAAFRTETEAVVARAGAKEEDQETFEEALDDLMDGFARGEKKDDPPRGDRKEDAVDKKGDAVDEEARGGKEKDKQAAKSLRSARRSSERRANDADAAADDSERGETKANAVEKKRDARVSKKEEKADSLCADDADAAADNSPRGETKANAVDTKRDAREKKEEKADYLRADDADELLDDFPRGETKDVAVEKRAREASERKEAEKETEASVTSRGLSRRRSSVSSRARALPGSREQAAANAAAEVREAHRVARRDAAAVRAGGTVKSRFVDSDPIDPRSVAASADRSYREIVEDDKREAAARVRAAARESWLGASSESDPVAFDASGRVTKTKTKTKTRAASLGDARDYVAAEADEPETPETPETARDDASDLTGSEIVVDATTLGLGEDLDAGEASGLLDAVAGSALARLGDAPLDPTDPDSEDYVAQMGSSPEDTRKLWAQFKAHLAKFEEAKDARARVAERRRPRLLGGDSRRRGGRSRRARLRRRCREDARAGRGVAGRARDSGASPRRWRILGGAPRFGRRRGAGDGGRVRDEQARDASAAGARRGAWFEGGAFPAFGAGPRELPRRDAARAAGEPEDDDGDVAKGCGGAVALALRRLSKRRLRGGRVECE